MVWSTTASSSPVKVSRSTCWCSRSPNAAILSAVLWRGPFERGVAAGRVPRVAASVGVAADRGRDAAAGGLEQRGHRQGGGGRHQRGVSAQELAEPEHDQ